MKDTRINVCVRGECGGSVDCAITEKLDRSVWYEVVVKVPGHPVWRIDLSKAVIVDTLVNAITQYIDSKPGSDRVHFPVIVSNGSPSDEEENLVRAATKGELEEELRRAFKPLVW